MGAAQACVGLSWLRAEGACFPVSSGLVPVASLGQHVTALGGRHGTTCSLVLAEAGGGMWAPACLCLGYSGKEAESDKKTCENNAHVAKTDQEEIFPTSSALGNQKWSALDPETHGDGERAGMSLNNAFSCIRNEAFLIK